MKKVIATTIALLAATPSLAGAQKTYQGTGANYDLAGKKLGSYQITVAITEADNGKIEEQVLITREDGSTHQRNCVSEKSFEVSSSMKCDDSEGGVTCLEGDMCQSYLVAEDGKAFASAIAFDKDGSGFRTLTTVLDASGQALGFGRDELTLIK
ncbi:MAG: hypothetical protein AB7T49_13430 [Oligoflexales bacterium]